MMVPKVSIVMAAKNYAKFLPMAVNSAIAQTFEDWELLIIDDGSTDATPDVVKCFSDSRIRYVRSDRLGQSRAKNLGVRLAIGEFIAFLDADDAWQPTKLAKQLKMMETSDAGVVSTARMTIDETILELPNSNFTMSQQGERGVKPVTTLLADASGSSGSDISPDDIFIRNPVCFSSVLVRREVFDRVGGFDESLDLSIDYDLWLRVAAHYKFVCLDEPLTLYRTGHGNLSKKQSDRIATAFAIMHRRGSVATRTARAEGFADTHRSLAWLYRGRRRAFANWLRAGSLKGFVLNSFRRAVPLSAENDPANR